MKEFLQEIINHIHNEWRRLIKERTKKKIKEKYDIDTTAWKESNANNPTVVKSIDKVVQILDDPENIEEEELIKVLDIILDLAPEHADFVLWRNLHSHITSNAIIKKEFHSGNYLQAAKEAVQIYNEAVQAVSRRTEDGFKLMEIAFGKGAGKLISLTNRSTPVEEDIEEGQKFLSQGIMVGFKNPAVSHTSRTMASVKKDFSNRNCLDILSTISFLFDRLEKRKKPLA